MKYDGIGNPLSYRGWTMSWQGGRQLASMTGSSKSLSFAYGESGLRLSKTCTVDDSSTVHTYTWNGDLLSSDICGNTALYFHYDANGSPMGFTLVNSEGSTGYFYVKNLQGDILKVIDAAGTVHASYTYDAWGNILSSSGDLADVNPLRYRGYYYDSETGLYYLQSRYYDPEVGRFINSDDASLIGADDSVLSYNLFAYCLNDPINHSDDGGDVANWLLGGFVGCVLGAGLEVVAQLISGTNPAEIDWGAVVIEGIAGAATGALLASGLPAKSVKVGKAIVNAGTSFAYSMRDGDSIPKALGKATVSAAKTIFADNGRSALNKSLSGKHLTLKPIEKLIKKLTYTPKHLDYYDVVVNNSINHSIGKTVSYLIER